MTIPKEIFMYNEIIWFGLDRFDRVMAFYPLCCGNIPEFVYVSYETLLLVMNYFCERVGYQPKSLDMEHDDGINVAFQSDWYEKFSREGIYCFDSYDGKVCRKDYTNVSVPEKPLLLSDLPDDIARALTLNRLNLDAKEQRTIYVKSAYPEDTSLRDYVVLMTNGKNLFGYFLSDTFMAHDFRSKARLNRITQIIKRTTDNSVREIKTSNGIQAETKTEKGYFEIVTAKGSFVLYIVSKHNLIYSGRDGLFSIQLYSKEKAVLDFNDKPGVWVEV